MKILFSLTYYYPYISGLTVGCQKLAEALTEKGLEVGVITSRFDKKLPNKDCVQNVHITRVPVLFKLSKGLIMPQWILTSFQDIKQHDVIIINLPQPEGIFNALWGRLFGKRVISVYHCDVVLAQGFANFLIQTALTFLNLIILLFSHTVIHNTQDFAENSKVLLRVKNKIKTTYPLIPLPSINLLAQKEFLEIIKPKPDYLIGIAARLSSEKGVEYLLGAVPLIEEALAASNKTFKVLIASPKIVIGEESYKANILDLAKKYTNKIVFLGDLKEKGSFYSLLDVFVLPSINSTESFGVVQVEAMLCGIPVVASNLPGVRVPIQKTGMGLLTPPKNSQKLAQAIIEVLTNREKFVKEKRIIAEEFSQEKTLDFYEKLLLES